MSEKTQPKPLHGLSPIEDWIAQVDYLESELAQAREQLWVVREVINYVLIWDKENLATDIRLKLEKALADRGEGEN